MIFWWNYPQSGKLRHLRWDIEEAIHRPVDVATQDTLFWMLKRRILAEARPIETLLSGKPNWAPNLPKDPRFPLWGLKNFLMRLEIDLHALAQQQGPQDPDRDAIARCAIQRKIAQIDGRLVKLTHAVREQYPAVPWADLEFLVTWVTEKPDNIDIHVLLGYQQLIRETIKTLIMVLPDDMVLEREIAGL